jgi:hypothetical protein
LSLVLAFHLNNLPRNFINIFFILFSIQALIVILAEFAMLTLVDDVLASNIRFFVIDSGWGDIYSNGLFFHIQIKGNALLPIAFMLLFVEEIPLKYKFTLKVIFLISIIFSGNFAFLIALFIFLIINSFINLKNNNQLYKRLLFFFVIAVLTSPIILNYVHNKIEVKNEGNSIFERTEQIKYLTNNLTQNPVTFLLGTGLGSTLNIVSTTRDYRGATYFEIQPMYFLSQMGVVFFGLFIIYSFLIAYLNYTNKTLFLIFCCYWIYASINPYIFDTNQFVVILLLNTIQNFINDEFVESIDYRNKLIYDYTK